MIYIEVVSCLRKDDQGNVFEDGCIVVEGERGRILKTGDLKLATAAAKAHAALTGEGVTLCPSRFRDLIIRGDKDVVIVPPR